MNALLIEVSTVFLFVTSIACVADMMLDVDGFHPAADKLEMEIGLSKKGDPH